MWAKSDIQINTLQVRGARDDDPALRLALTNLLSQADLVPSNLPPTAILLVRQIKDPQPGRVKARLVTTQVDTAWERAVQNTVTSLYRTASRPNQGIVPDHTQAVIFTDEGELLACLALQLSQDWVPQQWWWQTVLKAWSVSDLAELLCRQAVHIPAAFRNLERWGQVSNVVEPLSTHQIKTIMAALTRAYNLPDLSAILADVAAVDSQPHPTAAGAGQDAVAHSALLANSKGSERQPRQRISNAPWTAQLGRLAPTDSLTKPQQCLLGVALLLFQRPAVLRTAEFTRALHDWWLNTDPLPDLQNGQNRPSADLSSQPLNLEATGNMDNSQTSPLKGNAMPALDAEKGDENTTGGALGQTKSNLHRPIQEDSGAFAKIENELPKASTITPQEVKRNHLDRTPTDQNSYGKPHSVPENWAESELRQNQDSQENLVERGPAGSNIQNSQGQQNRDVEPDQSAMTFSTSEAGQALEKEMTPALSSGVSTRLGGALYLINLMLHLDLPACFETDWGLASQVGPWGILSLLIRALLGSTGAQFGDDALWLALAELADHRVSELPGVGFTGADALRLPPDWVNIDRSDICFYGADQTQLYLWVERQIEGQAARRYPLVSCPRQSALLEIQARRELETYLDHSDTVDLFRKPTTQVPLEKIDSPLLAGVNEHLARWLRQVLPFVRLRLEQALGGEQDLVKRLLVCPARLFVTSSHVDLVLNLDQIALPIRLAGLDRDPGWLPDWSRVVLFHFE